MAVYTGSFTGIWDLSSVLYLGCKTTDIFFRCWPLTHKCIFWEEKFQLLTKWWENTTPRNVKFSKAGARSWELTRGVYIINTVCWLSQMFKAAWCRRPTVWASRTQLAPDTWDILIIYISAFTIRGRRAVKSWLSWDEEERSWNWDTARLLVKRSLQSNNLCLENNKKKVPLPDSRAECVAGLGSKRKRFLWKWLEWKNPFVGGYDW